MPTENAQNSENDAVYQEWVSFGPATQRHVTTPEGRRLSEALRQDEIVKFMVFRGGKNYSQGLQVHFRRSADNQKVEKICSEIKDAVKDFARAAKVSLFTDGHGLTKTVTFTPYRS